MLPGATHGAWCGTRVWPSRCPTCGAKVWFFSCDCGSKVFFDRLGDPWPRHDCDATWGRSLSRRVDPDGTLRVDVAERVTAVSPPSAGGYVAVDLGPAPTRRALPPHPILRMDPPPGCSEEVLGVLREVAPVIDPYRKLGLSRTSFAVAALGPLGSQPVGRVTVHAASPEEPGLIESYTAWVPTALLAGLRPGITVTVQLEVLDVLTVGDVWFCSAVTVHR